MISDIPVIWIRFGHFTHNLQKFNPRNEPHTQPIESIPLYRKLFILGQNLMQFSHLRLQLQSGLFPIQVLPLN
jgi:hypothetical protein